MPCGAISPVGSSLHKRVIYGFMLHIIQKYFTLYLMAFLGNQWCSTSKIFVSIMLGKSEHHKVNVSSILYVFLATSDFISLNATFTLSDDALIQCVPIDIVSDSVAEDQECFTFSISTASTIGGLTLSPSEAEICISDEKGSALSRETNITHCFRYLPSTFSLSLPLCPSLSLFNTCSLLNLCLAIS